MTRCNFSMVTHQPRTLKVVSRREVIIIALDVVFSYSLKISNTFLIVRSLI